MAVLLHISHPKIKFGMTGGPGAPLVLIHIARRTSTGIVGVRHITYVPRYVVGLTGVVLTNRAVRPYADKGLARCLSSLADFDSALSVEI